MPAGEISTADANPPTHDPPLSNLVHPEDGGGTAVERSSRLESVVQKDHITSCRWVIGGWSSYGFQEKVESPPITCANLTWCMECYPKGRTSDGNTSLYLHAMNTESFGDSWEADVSFSFAVAYPSSQMTFQKLSYFKKFTKSNCSWGANSFLNVEHERQANPMAVARNSFFLRDDTIIIQVELTAVHDIRHELVVKPVSDGQLMHVEWTIENFNLLVSNIQQGIKVTSNEFSAFDHKWFLDAYPRGYNDSGTIALYLHMSLDSATKMAATRVPFTLWAYDYDAGSFEKLAQLRPTFGPKALCWGKHNLLKMEDFGENSRFVGDDGQVKWACHIGPLAENSLREGQMPTGDRVFIWRIYNFRANLDNGSEPRLGYKICSHVFQCGSQKWVLELYPRGYKDPNYVALYLHAQFADPHQRHGLQHEDEEADGRAVAFSLNVFDYTVGNFVSCGKLVPTFTRSASSWGKNQFKAIREIIPEDGSASPFLQKDTLILAVIFDDMNVSSMSAKSHGLVSEPGQDTDCSPEVMCESCSNSCF